MGEEQNGGSEVVRVGMRMVGFAFDELAMDICSFTTQ